MIFVVNEMVMIFVLYEMVIRVTENMVIFESGLPRGRNETISITDDNPKIWWQSNEVYSWPQPPSFPIENIQE